MTVRLFFDAGTLVLEGVGPDDLPESFVWDARIARARGPASCYHKVVLDLHRSGQPFEDNARAYAPLNRPHRGQRVPREYQTEAVAAWVANGRRGTVLLPTGAGKSFVAELCVARADRSALVIAPTLDLVGQWYDGLVRAFGEPIGLLGGGHHEVEAITVSTYDSALIHCDRLGARFGLVVFDEVHHLPSFAYSHIADALIAPFRLGLTATLERPDGQHARLNHLVGPVVYERQITELAGEFLAPYRTEVIRVELSPEERDAYEDAEANWRGFVQEQRIRLGAADGWGRFLQACARSTRGREALLAWQTTRRLVQSADAKIRLLAELLRRHAGARTLVFTNDNDTAYTISRRLLLPTLTHQTDLKERRALLSGFSDGTTPVLVTSKVLNEGVDVPEAEVAIVLSGSATVREHVQRLGRILRPRDGKQATLYELVVADSRDERTSAKRRDHDAYRD
jgi:superfamily II DNA or RNA helicase